MHKIYVPVTNSNFPRDRAGMVSEIRRMGVSEYVFIGTGMRADCGGPGQPGIEGIQESCAYLHKEGFKVCAWKWSWRMPDDGYMKQVASDGVVSNVLVCPSDQAFLEYSCQIVRDIAATGVDMIMFDDDFHCFGSYVAPIGCCCENHRKLVSEKVGEPVSLELLAEKLLDGGANIYRSAWIEVNAEMLRNFARKIRAAVDTVNPNCRIGICCTPSSWDYSADISEIAHIMAGNTKPFLRLAGAPYWAVERLNGGFRMQDVIEFERKISHYCDEDIEIVGEGDTFPRPRFRCPASYLEAFHMALLADGRVDGILKYGIDYSSKANYETGYTDLYLENLEIYDQIEEHLTKKEDRGVYVLEAPRKYENLVIPEKIKEGEYIFYYNYGKAGSMLAANTIPTAYHYNGYGTIAFGDNSKYASQEVLDGGMILDVFAAKNLEELGVDVGLKSIGKRIRPTKEYFIDEDDCVNLMRMLSLSRTAESEGYTAELKDGVKLLTRYVVNGAEIPGSYLYENAKGQRFLVFLFDGYYCGEGMFRMYTRARQIKNSMQWLCGKDLPAFCGGNPDLYMMYKEDAGKAAVGLWNFSADPVLRPYIELNRSYKKLTCINCKGTLEGNKVYLSKLYSNEFAGFAVE